MFKALMGGGRSSSSSDVRSSSKSSRRKSEKTDKFDTRSISSRKSSRGDDRDRGLGDLSSYSPSASRSKRGPPSIAGESIASTYVTAEPEAIDDSDRYYIERTPKRRDSERESKSSRRRDLDRSESPEREKRRSRRGTQDTLDDDLDRERDRRDRRRTHSGDPYMPPISTNMPPSAPGAQFAAEIGAPGFSQFPMQHDTGMPSADHTPPHEIPYDPHVQQQFPGQFPEEVAAPYRPPNPAGAAADYYGDQGQSVEHQPGIRPAPPSVLPNTQAHLMAASPSANPPPEPSSLGETGAAAAYFDDDFHAPVQQSQPPAVSSSRPPKPSKPAKPSSSGILPAAAVGAAAYGIGDMMSHSESHSPPQHTTSYTHQGQSVVQGQAMTHNQAMEYNQAMASSSQMPPSKPSHSHSFSEGVGIAAAGAATGYMVGHHHHSSSPEHAPQYAFQHHEQASQAGGMLPYAPGHNNALYTAGAGGYAAQAAYNPGFYPHGPSALAFQERQRGPMGRFVDFWRDPEAVGRFEDYTETIGVCKYCFQPGTSSVDAPRKHHYHRRRRNSPDRRSSGSSRVSKNSRYNSSDDEGRRRLKSKKSSSWLPGMLAGYATKSLFSSKEFDDSYSIRSGRVASSHGGEDDRRSHTSRGVTRRSGRSPQREHYADSKHASQSGHSRHTRSRSRSSSRSGRHSYLKEAALGAAVGGAALAVAKSRNRSHSRSPERRHRRKDSSSSSSFVNLPRPAKKSIAGGIGSFFTASSENKKKRHTKKRSGFFSFKSGSSSSSLDNDLAFGDGFSKKSSKFKKKGRKGKDVDAALVELSDTATRLAGSSPHGPGRSAGQMYTPRSRQSNYAHSTTQDEEWVDAESEDQSSTSVSSALAFGGSSVDSSSDSASSKWGWRWGSKKDKKKKDKRSSASNAVMLAGAGAIGAAAISSTRHHDSSPPSRSGSLQQVYPMPTSDPSRFDVAKMSPSVSAGEPALIRPGPIPLQQPQPFTPVSQSVYTTQGAVPGSIPVYSAPAVPPIFANGAEHYNWQVQAPRDAAWAPEESSYADRRKPHRRSDSSPVFSTQETASSLKRRFTAKDQASVQFNLTEEQAERERRLIRRDKNYRDEFADQPVQLIDREEELARLETERRERRRKERDDEERRYAGDRETDSSSWVGVAAAGAVGAVAASTILSRKTDDDEASEASQRYNERRERRRAERKHDTDTVAASSIVSRFEPAQPINEEVTTVEHREDQKKGSPRSPRPAQVYDDYAKFYAPEELRHSPDDHARSRESTNMPTIVEIEPASERRTHDEPAPTEVDYSYEPYQHVDRLPWPVPGLNLIEPTPPQSVNGGSVRDVTSPIPPVNKSHDTKPRERSTGSRVSWGEHETHEYDIPSSSEQDPLEHDISPTEISAKDVPLPASEISQPKDIPSTSQYGADIEFAATIAAATAAAGFDPALVTDDPSYHTRTSPPGSEDEHTFTSPWSASARKEPHGFVEGEIEEIDPKSTIDMTYAPEHVVQDKDELFFEEPESFSGDRDISSGRRDKASIAQEVIEQLNGKYGKRDRTASPEKDVDAFSMPGGFDTADSRDLADARSVVSAPAPVAMDSEPQTKSESKKSRRSGDVFDLPEFQERELAEPPVLKDETPESRKSRRSGDDFEIYESREASPSPDDSYSIVSAPVSKEETSKSKSRKSRRSGDDLGIVEYPESVVPESRDDSFSVISAPVSKDETSKSKSRKSRRSGDDFEIYESREPSESRDDTHSVTSTPAGKEYESSKTGQSRRSEDDYDLPRSREVSGSYDDTRSVFSAPVSKDETNKSRRSRLSGDDFDISRSRDVSESRDESRSVVSESAKSRKSRRSGDDFDPRRDAEVAPEDAEGGEEKKRRRKRRSKHEGDTFSVDDDARSAITDIGDDKSERRKHRHRSSREAGFDDNASITSSPARIDESRERRKGKDEKEKSGGFLRSIFGSQVSAPAERVRSDHSRSSSLDKRASREAISEVGVDDERRRHKKRSSKHRSSSNGDELDRYMSDKEKGTQDDTNLEEYRSSRQQKEERRRHRYEEIVESGRKRESEKDGYSDNFDDQSFLRKHPEILAPEREDYGASWLPAAAANAAVVAAASGLNEIPQQRARSHSTSPPATEKTLDLTPKSLSRPASPETSHPQGSRSPKQRRHSVAKSTNESPTAVPLHFRRPPTSPGLSRAVPVEPPAPIASPGSPSQQRTRRPGSVEFRNSREIRPLWLVERHSLIKGEPESVEPLPSLPSSKTSSRAPSMDNQKSIHDDEGLKSWEHVDLSDSIMEIQRPTGLTISTDQANESHDRDLDLLGSQQATPTAEHFQDSESRKEKRIYEFHSPSELLQDPAVLDELPPSPTLDALPSAEGSMVGVGSREQETQRALDALEGVSRPQPESATPTQEKESFMDFAEGAGFAGVVDAAAIAAVKEHDQSRSLPADEPEKAHGFSDIVDAAVGADGPSHDHDKAPVDEEPPSEPVTAIEDNFPAMPEPVHSEMETVKEFVPESTEQPVESPDPQPLPDAPMVEAVSAEPEVAIPEQSEPQPVETSRELGPELGLDEPGLEAAPVESAPIESTHVEPEVVVPERSEAEPIEVSRELNIEPLVAATQETEVVTTPEFEPAEVAPNETEQTEDTASSTKKAKRDKKKQKKKSKNTSTSEEPADDTVDAQPEDDTSASKEIEDQEEDKAHAPVEETVAAPLSADIATSIESPENTADQTAIPSAATDEEQAQSRQESRELVEPVEQVSTEESVLPVSEDPSLPVEEQQTPEPDFTDANETQITGATQPGAEEVSRSLEDIEKPTEDSTPEAPLDDTTPEITETPKEDTEGEDNFQEAVEEHISQPAEEKEPAPEPPIEVAADVADTPAEASETKAEKRKNKKKKNRKSAAVEENQVSAETPASETELQPESQDLELEQSVVVQPVDTQSPPIGGEALPSDPEHLEHPTNDVEQPVETTIEEPAATQEQEQVPLEAAVDATHVVTEPVDPVGPSDELSQPAVIDVEPNAELPGPAEEASREISEPAAVETKPEVEVQAEPQLEVEAEPEVALTAAQKKKAKKNKKKGKQSESSIPDDEKPAESISPAPEIEIAAEDMAKEAPLITEDAPVDAPTQEREMELPVEVEQSLEPEDLPEPEEISEAMPPQAEASPDSLPEPTIEVTEAETLKEEPTAPEEQPKAEESHAEPEVPMTAAERKKAKKAKKKQQKEQEEGAVAAVEDIKPVEAEPAPEAESAERSKDITPVAETDDVTPAELSALVSSEATQTEQDVAPTFTDEPEAAPVAEDTLLPTDTETIETVKEIESPVEDVGPSSQIESTEVIADVPLVSQEVTTPADVLQGLDQQDVIAKAEEPKSENVTPAPTEGPSVDAVETDAPKTEEQSPEPEVPMTAAERKKAKKNKKKQQKQESVQLDEQPTLEAEPNSTEEKSVEHSGDILPESDATPTTEAVSGVDEPTEPEVARDLEAEAKPEEEQTQEVPIVGSELTPEAPADEAIPTPEVAEQAIDIQDGDKEATPEPPAEVPASTEDLQEEQKLDPTVNEEPALDKSIDDNPTESTAEPVVEETQPTESTESPVAEQAEDEQAATSSKSKKKKNKKKRQSVAAEEEQPAPAEEEPKAVSAEEEVKLAPAEEEPTSMPTEGESTEPTPSQDLEQPSVDKDVETVAVTEEPSPQETTQSETPADAAAIEAAEEESMTPAQKRKAKKDKKKRQSVTAEVEQPIPAEEEVKITTPEEEPTSVPAENESTEPAPSQELEQTASDKDVEAPVVMEEAPKAEEPTQLEAPTNADTTENAEEASMTPAQKRKAKKDKKKRQSVAAEQEQPTPADEEVKLSPAEEEPAFVPAEPEPTESTEAVPSQELDQPSPDEITDTPIVTDEAPKAEEPSPEETPADAAAIEAAEEASMTPAQKRKAKKDKKKRQSVIAEEEQSMPVEESKPELAEEVVISAPIDEEPTPESVREEPVEPIQTQESEQPIVGEDAATSIPIEEEAPKAEERAAEEIKQQDAAVDTAAAEAAEESSMTPAQKRKAKKDKKKRQSVIAEEEESMPIEESKPKPAEGVIIPAPIDEDPTPESVREEPVEPIQTQESEQLKVDEDAATSVPIDEEAPKDEEPSPEETTQPEAPTDAAAIEAAEEASMTPAQKRKAKKEKKKRQSVIAEEEQSTSVEEPKPESPQEEPIEPESTREIEQPTIDQDAQAPIITEEEAPKAEEPSLEEVTQQNTPADTAATEAAEEEAMTPAQKKKAKKDKKKQRKSVAFDDEATLTEELKAEQELSAPEDKVESQDAPADLTMSEESAKDLQVTEEVAEPAAEGEAPEKTEEPASSEQSKGITELEPVSTAALDTPIPVEVEEPISAAELPEQPEQDAQTLSEPQSPSAQEPEVPLTAAQKKKAKKNKKKGKSVDLADNAPTATDAAQESEPIVQTSTDTLTETPELQDTPASDPAPAQPAEGLEQENTIEPEATKAEELVTTETVSDDVSKEETPDVKETDNEPPATEAIVDAEPTPPQEADSIATSPTETTEDAGMSAKERRKAAKKAKKRQSKNVDADNDAAASDSLSAPTTEPATPVEAANSVEKVLTSTDTDAPGLSAVSASSPAEHDGKEHQSHDIETYDATAQNTASTDTYMSSQIEQTPIESPFLDYPPQPVLERSVDSGELVEENAQQEGDVAPTVQEREGERVEPAPLEEMKIVENGENVEERSSVPEAGDLSAEKGVEEKDVEETPVDAPIDVVPETQTQESPVEEEASETAVSKKQKKKNKKKNKKQEEEAAAPEPETSITDDKEQPEAAPLVEAEPQVELKETTEAEPIAEVGAVPVPDEPPANHPQHIEENDDAKEISAAEVETESVSVPVEQPADHPQVIEETAAVQTTEEIDHTKDISIPEAEVVAPTEETTQPEAPADAAATEAAEEASMTPAQKRKAKKDKKKQRQSILAQEPEAEPQPKEQLAPEAAEASVQEAEISTESVPAEIITQDEAVASTEASTVQPLDATEEAAKDLVTPSEDTEQHVPIQEIESGERSLELPFTESKIEEGDKPAEEAAETPAAISDAEQPSEQASPEVSPKPEGESMSVPKKMSKKEKKKAAAAAAAAALLEEEKPVESQPEPEEPSIIIPQALEEVVEQPIVQEPQPSETEGKSQPEAEKSQDEIPELATSEPKENVLEQPVEALKSTEPLEFEDKPEEYTKEPAEEPAAADTVTRKASKKDKKKAKKQAKQEVIEPAFPLTDEHVPTTEPAPTEIPVPEATFDEIPTELVPLTEPAITGAAIEREALEETPTETILESESIGPSEIQEVPKPDAESIETPALEEIGIVSEDKQPSESETNEAVVSHDTLDTPSPVGPTDPDTNNEPVDLEGSAEKNDQEDEAHVGADARDLEKTADLEVVDGLVEERPGEPEVMPALSKKMSKKDKRKAKKNASITEEVSTQQQDEPQADVAELPTESAIQPTEPVVEQEIPKETDHVAEAQPTTERDLSMETLLTIEDQPIPNLEVQVEPTRPDEEPVSEETPLSRKASKKKSKKAQKANKSLDTEPAAENAIDADQHATIGAFEEDQSKAQDPEVPDEKSSYDEEAWPAIDWQAKFEESQRLRETNSDPEPDIPPPEPEIIGEFVDSSFPEISQDTNEVAEEDAWALPASKKDQKKAKKNKKQSQQAAPEVEEPLLEPSNDKEIEPPARTTTPGGSKIANLFPGLERSGFRRSALDQRTPSLKDSAEEETPADLEANRDIAIPVSEAPLATTETKEIADDFTSELPSSLERQIESAISELKAHSDTPTATEDESIREPELPTCGEKSLDAPLSSSREPSNERTDAEEPSSPTRFPPPAEAGEELCGLRRSPSIHGRRQHTPRTWNLEEPSLQALRAPSPPRSLFGPTDDYVRPRTPLDTIAEQEPRDAHGVTMARRGTPRLEMKPEHVLPRPQTPVRKFTDNAFDREAWPTENQKEGFEPEVSKTPEQGILKPSTSSGKLRRTNRSISGDLRAASRALDSQPSNLDLDQLPSSSSYDPVTDKGKRPLRNMSDVYEGWGETPNSPRSPSRPPSVRRRRSMQHLQEIETRLDQLISENRLLIAARDEAEDKLRNTSVARRKSDRALNTRDGDLRDRESEVEQLKNSVEWLQKEMTRVTQENEGLAASNSALAAAHAAEVTNVRESSTRELAELQSRHTQLSSQMEDRVRQEIESALAQKDIELRRLRTELEEARDKVKELQQQIAASVHDNALVFRGEEYFEAACQKLCGHVQSWVVRFSKHNDKRRCRPLSELQDEKIADRFDNALLDGSDPDAYLSDRVRRRDVFMSVVMTMVWEYIFTRYLFGMDREQRQKLKSLEKQLGEVGPTRAVHRWRATTLTLLSRRPAFAAQRESDTEAVTLEIFQTLSQVLPPPSHVESQLLDNLRKIMRVAVSLSLEMRTQLAEFIMLPPLQPEYDTNGDLARQVYFNAALMNERSGLTNDNSELEAQQSIVRIVLFPLVVKKGNDVGEGEDEEVVCPAQVLIARPSKDKKVSRMMSGDRMSIDASRSVHSITQSIAHSVAPSSMMDMSNVI